MMQPGNNHNTPRGGLRNGNRQSTVRTTTTRPGRNGNHPTTTTTDLDHHSQAWLEAIQHSTVCVRGQGRAASLQDLEASLAYLGLLESILMQKPKHMWKYPPDADPPRFDPGPTNGVHNTTMIVTPDTFPVSPVAVVPAPVVFTSTNPFAVFLDFDDDDDDSDDEQQRRARQSNDEGGDEIVLDYHAGGMDVLRLVVRLDTSQSDVLAGKASLLAQQHKEWTQGAACLQHAIIKVRQALELADAQISKWYENRHQQDQGQDGNEEEDWMKDVGMASSPEVVLAEQQKQRQQDLMQDADIVHVSIQSLLDQRARYVGAAEHEANRLRRRLRPQWESRDQAKQRMGDRWTHNPHPKNDHAARRRADEEQLRKLEQALALLEQYDTQALEETAQLLKIRLESNTKNRYNGQRPTDLSKRIPGYPDATEYGWAFTGSADNVVEFFQKTMENGTLVKLDFYFTTGTVKTSLRHPTQGKTQMFAKSGVTPDMYVKILENPRAHTGVRYKRKAKQ
eukprot:scaffold3199_cov165-Amphora_coffeaeformis.AAC.7